MGVVPLATSTAECNYVNMKLRYAQGSTFRVVKPGSRIGHGCGHIKGHKETLFEWSGQKVGLAMGVVTSKGTRKHFLSGQDIFILHFQLNFRRKYHFDQAEFRARNELETHYPSPMTTF